MSPGFRQPAAASAMAVVVFRVENSDERQCVVRDQQKFRRFVG